MQIWCKGDSTEQPPRVRSSPSVALSLPPLAIRASAVSLRLLSPFDMFEWSFISHGAQTCDSFINKVNFPTWRYYFRIREIGGGWLGFGGRGGASTYLLSNFTVLLTLVVIFLSSQDPEVTASQLQKYWSLTVDQQDKWICHEVQIQHLSASISTAGLWLHTSPHILNAINPGRSVVV